MASTPLVSDQPAGKADFFRRILTGALAGLGGAAQLHPQNALEGAGAGFLGVQDQQDRLLKRDLATQALELQRQQVANDTTRANATAHLDEAQAAKTLTEKLQLEKLIGYLPQAQADEHFKNWAQGTALLAQAGFEPVAEMADTDEARTGFLKQIQAQGGKVTDYTFGPSGNGKIIALKRDNTKELSPEVASSLSKITGMKFPAGLPTSVADNLITSIFSMKAQIQVANLAYARELEVARLRMMGTVPPTIEKTLSQLDTSEAILTNIQNLFEKNPSMVGGLAATGLSDTLKGKGALGGAARSMTGTLSASEATFRNLVQQDLNEEINRLSGSAVSAQEFERMKKGLPNVGMSAPDFRAAVQNSINRIKLARQGIYRQVPGAAARAGAGAPSEPASDVIKVRRKSDGAVGSIPKANFDPAKYDPVQ